MHLRVIFIIVVSSAVLDFKFCDAAQAYQNVAFQAHNKYRALHQSTPALIMDENLNNLAVQCAQYYAERGAIDHSCPYKNGAGENLIGGFGTWTPDQFATMGPQRWYEEIKFYNYNRPIYDPATGHFTQLIWKSSQTFGFGSVYSPSTRFTAGVGLYSPPGNYLDQFRQNVLPPL